MEAFVAEQISDDFTRELFKRAKRINKKIIQIEELESKLATISKKNKAEVMEKVNSKPSLLQSLESLAQTFELYLPYRPAAAPSDSAPNPQPDHQESKPSPKQLESQHQVVDCQIIQPRDEKNFKHTET